MPKKSAAKSAAQADLLSNDRGLNATVGAVNAQKKNEVANVEAKPKGKQVAKAKSEVDHKPGTLLSSKR
jgi:hypothetical protein